MSQGRHCLLPKFSPWVTLRWGAHSETFPWGISSTPDIRWLWCEWLCINDLSLLPSRLPSYLFLSSYFLTLLFLSFFIFWKFTSHISVNLFILIKTSVYSALIYIILCNVSLSFCLPYGFSLSVFYNTWKTELTNSCESLPFSTRFTIQLTNICRILQKSAQDWFSVNSYSLSERY